MIGFLAGAGFSKWAAGLPLTNELFDFNINPFGIREKQKLNKVYLLKKEWNIKHPEDQTEAFINYSMRMSKTDKDLILWYIVRRLSEPYIWTQFNSGKYRRQVLMIDEQRANNRPGVNETRKFIITFIGPMLEGIITTNYDLLFEYALGSSRFNYGLKGEYLYGRGPYPTSILTKPVRLTGFIPLAKVHGSISWDKNSKYTDGRRGLSGKALIVPPTPNKKVETYLQTQWNLSKKILLKSNSLLVFGFAFNKYDKEFLSHLKENGKNIKNIMIVNINKDISSAINIWPSANIEYTSPPPEGHNKIRPWVKDSSKLN